MNYSISELNDCIFGYLTTVPNQAKSLPEILSNITQTTGHRCEALANDVNNSDYRRKFLESCDTLDNTYKNIYKFYKNNMFYVMYSDKDPNEVNQRMEYYYGSIADTSNDETIFVSFGPDIILDYFLSSTQSQNSQNNRYMLSVKEYLSKCTVNDAQRIFDKYKFSPDKQFSGTSLLQMAIDNNNAPLVEYLVKEKYSGKITKLKADNLTLKKNNTVLLLNNKTLDNDNKKLKKELGNTKIFQLVPIGVLVSVIVGLVSVFVI